MSRTRPAALHLAAIGFFAAVAFVEAWPLALHFTSQLVGHGGDGFQTLWHFWLVARWPETGQSPLATRLIFWPTGTTLHTHVSNVLNALLTWPILRTLGPVAAYNAAALIHLVLNATGAYLLAFRLLAHRPAALVAGLGFGFSAYFSAHLLGHLVLLSAGFLPLGILFALEALETGRLRPTLLAGLAFALDLATLSHALFLALALAVALPWLLLHGDEVPGPRTVVRRACVLGAVALACAAPVAMLLHRELVSTPGVRVPSAVQATGSADLLAWVTPSPFHPVFRHFASTLSIEGLVFPGFTVWMLAAIGALSPVAAAARHWPFAGRLGPRYWSTLAVIAIVLSLGPELHVGHAATGVPLPFAALAHLPGLDTLSSPGRFAVLGQLALTILAATGLARLTARVSGRTGRVLSGLLLALVAFECLWLPYPRVAIPPPSPFFEKLRTEGGVGAIVDVPFLTYDPVPMVDQMTHGRPILAGYVSRFPADCVGCLVPAPLSEFWPRSEERDILPPVDLARDGAALLRSWDVEYVVVHRDRLAGPQLDRALQAIRVMGLGAPVYADVQVEAFRVPDDLRSVARLTTALVQGTNFEPGGWSAVEVHGLSPTRRIVRPDSGAGVLIWATAPTSARLGFVARKSGPGRRLQVTLDGEMRFDERVRPEPQRVEVDLRLRKGANLLTLRGGMTVGPMSLRAAAPESGITAPGHVQEVGDEER